MTVSRGTVLTLSLAAAVLLAAVGIFLAVRAGSPEEETGPGSAGETGGSDSGIVVWKGKTYEYNDHLSNYLFIGVDRKEMDPTNTGQGNAGQADALYLVSRDRVEDTVRVITIPRDTMTDIPVYLPSGESAGTARDHISLAYSFGDGRHESCRLTRDAVSSLLYGVPVLSYCAMGIDGLPLLMESVGDLTVTVPDDSLEEAYPEFREGEQITLTPDNIERFLRYRDTGKAQSALDRSRRQQVFLDALAEAVRRKMAVNPGFPADLYLCLKSSMVTGMSADQFAELAESAVGGTVLEGWTVPGEGIRGKAYDEYIVDEDALYSKVMETFYREVETQ